MTTTLTYDNTLGRVKVALSAAPAAADYALVERSIDGINWTTVRGGDRVGLTAGAGTLYDYEFKGNVQNTYRVSYVDQATPSILAAGTLSTAVNANTTPGLPAGLVEGDVVIGLSSIRNSGVGVANLPANWTALAGSGTNFLVCARRWGTGGWEDGVGAAAPTFTYTGGAANEDTMGRLFAMRNGQLPANSATSQLNASALNCNTPAYAYTSESLLCRCGWRADDNTGASYPGLATTIMTDNTITGNDASMFAFGGIAPVGSSGNFPAADIVITGVAAISRGVSLSIPKASYVKRESQNITPSLTQVWIKNVQRPYLNKTVTLIDFSDISVKARADVMDVVGRNNPVAITDVRRSQEQTITITTLDLDGADDMQTRLMTGETIFLHTPDRAGGCPVQSRYAIIGDVTRRRTAGKRAVRRFFDLPLQEVAAPASTVVGNTITWADVIALYATWADLIAAEPTWSDVLDSIAPPTDVIVP